jgi:hypothetical protein
MKNRDAREGLLFYWENMLSLTREMLFQVSQKNTEIELLLENRERLLNLIQTETPKIKKHFTEQDKAQVQDWFHFFMQRISPIQKEYEALDKTLIEILLKEQLATKKEIKQTFLNRIKIQSYCSEL